MSIGREIIFCEFFLQCIFYIAFKVQTRFAWKGTFWASSSSSFSKNMATKLEFIQWMHWELRQTSERFRSLLTPFEFPMCANIELHKNFMLFLPFFAVIMLCVLFFVYFIYFSAEWERERKTFDTINILCVLRFPFVSLFTQFCELSWEIDLLH